MQSGRFPSVTGLAVAVALAAAFPLRAEDKKAEPKVVRLAHIKLSGSLKEGPVAKDPLFGSSAESFKTKLDRIKKAAADKNVQALYLQLDGIGAGWGKIDELRRAVADFRKAGKKAYAYLADGATKDYLVAAACDKVCLPESGSLMLTGLRGEVTFYKGLLDCIGVKADMLQMGEYKGAAEPMTRSTMSKAYRERLTAVLKDYYEESIVAAIVQSRAGKKLTAAKVKALIDEGPYTARGAKKAGLIDEISYAGIFTSGLKTELKADQLIVVRDYGKEKSRELDFNNPLAVFRLLFSPPTRARASKNDKIAIIYATGVIVTGKSGYSLLGGKSVGSTTLVEAIRKAEKDKTVKAIVLRVDSPGGSALASDLIWHELTKCKKPVVASMSDTAASGGYYISMAARKIFAEPSTLTGSIGVVGGKMVLGGLEKKIGINTEVIGFGKNSGILSSTAPFTASERKAMKAHMQDIYDQFLAKAIKGRAKAGKKFTHKDFLKYAEGRIWTGRQARTIGLIDELGTLDDALKAAQEMAKLPKDAKPELLILPKPTSILDSLMGGAGVSALGGLQGSALKKLPHLAGHLAAVEGLLELRGEPVWLILPHRVVIR
jgi:protease-4